MDKLTLEHIAPYLPYSLEFTNMALDCFGNIETRLLTPTSVEPLLHPQNDKKPILRPLSDLTKEIEHNGERFTPNNRIDQYTQIGGDGKLYLLVDGALWSCNPLSWDYYLVVKLISWHFDVFGLIGKGLAIDYNTVKGGPNEI